MLSDISNISERHYAQGFPHAPSFHPGFSFEPLFESAAIAELAAIPELASITKLAFERDSVASAIAKRSVEKTLPSRIWKLQDRKLARGSSLHLGLCVLHGSVFFPVREIMDKAINQAIKNSTEVDQVGLLSD